MTILQGAIARMRAQPVGLAIWWGFASVAMVGVEQGARLAGVDPASPLPSEADAWYRVARALVEGVTGAAGFRLTLQGRLWLDRGFIASAAILTAIALAAGFGVASPHVRGLSGAAQGALTLILFYLSLKLMLWPLGPLTGRRDLTLPRAWNAMEGAMLGMTLASLLALVPLVGVGVLALQLGVGPPDGLLAIVVDAVSVQAYALVSLGMTATVYALCVQAPATVADVFD
jgi:hypothetical protein